MKLFVLKIILIFFLAIFRIATHSGYSVKLNDILSSKKSQGNSGYFDFFLKTQGDSGRFKVYQNSFFDSKSGNFAFIFL